MSADDQAFLDILSSVPNDIKKYSADVADYVDSHLEKVSNTIRDALSSSKWVPESARPRPLPPPSRTFEKLVPLSVFGRIESFVQKNKILSTGIVIVIAVITHKIIKKTVSRKKRRAKRASNGARLEVVVIAGSPSEPITRSIALDLERRGFIVYIVCNTIEEEALVQNEGRPDIKPLSIDIVDPESAQASLEHFTIHLQTPHAAFQGAKPHHLTLRSIILIPSSTYPVAPIATLAPGTLSDLLNTRLLTPILTTQTFLPLLQSLPFPQNHNHSHTHPPTHHPSHKPSILLLTPSIIPSLSPSFHAPESLINNALSTFATVLASELSPLSIPLTQLKLGTFDLSAFAHHSNRSHIANSSAQRSSTLKWDADTRKAYGRNYVAMGNINDGIGSGVGFRKGSSLRELNNAVFDAMVSGKGGVVRVGMGSRLYGFVGKWMPRGLVAWMMGVRRVGDYEGEFGGRSAGGGLLEDGKRVSGSEDGKGKEGNVYGLGGSEYVSVYDDVVRDKYPEGEYADGFKGDDE